MDSILTSIKKLLGMTKDYTHFDADIIMNINTEFMSLKQLGIGPADGFIIEDDSATWDEYINVEDDPSKLTLLSAVKSYIHLKVELAFDPPQNSSVTESIKQRISELEWRLNVEAESKQ